jgi:hypothetical protein
LLKVDHPAAADQTLDRPRAVLFALEMSRCLRSPVEAGSIAYWSDQPLPRPCIQRGTILHRGGADDPRPSTEISAEPWR